MRVWKASLLLAASLSPSTLWAEEFSLTGPGYQLPGVCRSKLDLNFRCGAYAGPGRWAEFKKAEPRFARNAITVRFGGPSPNSPSKLEVQVGSFLQQALFLAALAVFLL